MAQSRREGIRGILLASGAVLVPAGMWRQAPGVRAAGRRPRMALRFRPYTFRLRHVFTVAVSSRAKAPVVLTEIECDGTVGDDKVVIPDRPGIGARRLEAAGWPGAIGHA